MELEAAKLDLKDKEILGKHIKNLGDLELGEKQANAKAAGGNQ